VEGRRRVGRLAIWGEGTETAAIQGLLALPQF